MVLEDLNGDYNPDFISSGAGNVIAVYLSTGRGVYGTHMDYPVAQLRDASPSRT